MDGRDLQTPCSSARRQCLLVGLVQGCGSPVSLQLMKNKTKRMIRRRARGGDVAAVAAVNFAMVKHRRRRAVNEIHAAGDDNNS